MAVPCWRFRDTAEFTPQIELPHGPVESGDTGNLRRGQAGARLGRVSRFGLLGAFAAKHRILCF